MKIVASSLVSLVVVVALLGAWPPVCGARRLTKEGQKSPHFRLKKKEFTQAFRQADRLCYAM